MPFARGNVKYDDMEYQQGPRAEALVSKLESVISVPRKQIEKYMKLRSERSVDKLTDIMQEYRSVQQGGNRGPALESEQADSTKPDASALENIRKVRGMAWQSTYASFHNSLGRRSKSAGAGRQAVGSGAFDKVWRNGEKPQLDQWKETTTDDKIRQLADTCRGIYSLEEQEKGSASEYRKKYGWRSAFTPRVTRDRNRSEVPIGSIYSTDPWELEASAVREKEAKDALLRVHASQNVMKKYKSHPKQTMQLTFIDKTKMNRYKESAEVTGCLCPRSRADLGTIRSEYRGQYIAHNV